MTSRKRRNALERLSLEDVLRHGITRAMMSVEFYSSVVERVKDPEARQLLEKILRQEFNSVRQLVDLLERHKRKRTNETSGAP